MVIGHFVSNNGDLFDDSGFVFMDANFYGNGIIVYLGFYRVYLRK